MVSMPHATSLVAVLRALFGRLGSDRLVTEATREQGSCTDFLDPAFNKPNASYRLRCEFQGQKSPAAYLQWPQWLSRCAWLSPDRYLRSRIRIRTNYLTSRPMSVFSTS